MARTRAPDDVVSRESGERVSRSGSQVEQARGSSDQNLAADIGHTGPAIDDRRESERNQLVEQQPVHRTAVTRRTTKRLQRLPLVLVQFAIEIHGRSASNAHSSR